jgi:hypothetical protein
VLLLIAILVVLLGSSAVFTGVVLYEYGRTCGNRDRMLRTLGATPQDLQCHKTLLIVTYISLTTVLTLGVIAYYAILL